jgi:transcription-repair coupling factor (superfamily II helicase)
LPALNTKELIKYYSETEKVRLILQLVQQGKSIQFKGIYGAYPAILASVIFQESSRNILAIMPDEEQAAFFHSDLQSLIGLVNTALLPSSYKRPFQVQLADNVALQERSEVLLKLEKQAHPLVLVTHPEALAERVISQDELANHQLELVKGDTLDLDYALELFADFGFEREDFVFEAGQFAIRGGIVDVFSYANELPYRFELDGREIESIREFDPETQLSTKELQFASIVPNLQREDLVNNRQSLFNYFDSRTVIFAKDFKHSLLQLDIEYDNLDSDIIAEDYFSSIDELKKEFRKRTHLEWGNLFSRSKDSIEFNQTGQLTFGKSFDKLIEYLQENTVNGIQNVVFSQSNKQIERLQTIFDDLFHRVSYEPIYQGLSQGFVDAENKIAVLTEHQIFSRQYTYRQKKQFRKSLALTVKELRSLQKGDFVVHIDHGVGQFQGLQKIEMAGRLQEAVRIMYKNGDLLYVNIASLHKISRYSGKEGHQPRMNKLGSDTWQKLKTKTKSKVKDIARDLIKLYAKRKSKPGFAYAPDSYLQVELEASFMHQDTLDQTKATDDIKRDMESPHPMDRLICGDVGFGKTEVAIRAAFKAVNDSKQVAVLVPTTILAQQHYHTFRDRLEELPVTVDYINRFRTTKQQNHTLQALSEGKVDIIIGTHRLLNKKVEFKDLGLIIVDEEQKFGVSAKEKLKQMRVNVDTLTLTATPIPRTLHFSLMGARDLSVINTPPANRLPVQTELHIFNREVLKETINQELARGGQVFFVHNKVQDIEDIAHMIRTACPGARVTVGHGQMKGDELENVMISFIQGDYDVLVATTIIESGLDIPNANTIIINNAHYFGLSDLHQMRGRVGRSNRKAYCILFCPGFHGITADARQRLTAIEEFSALGSGFNVALRDLDIRGAGNLLGGEQSGFISEIGFDMYHKILDEAIAELKEDEFKGVFDQKQEDVKVDCTVETDLDILIPETYVNNVAERLSLYNQLSRLKNTDELDGFRQELEDRFGPIPNQAIELLNSLRLKFVAQHMNFVRIRIKNMKLFCTFPDESNIKYFNSEAFSKILQKVQLSPGIYNLKQKGDKLVISMPLDGAGVNYAIEELDRLAK